MNPFFIIGFFSLKKELFYVSLAFLLVILLPAIGVIVLTKTGLDFVSEKLVSIDEITKEIELLNPFDGKVYKKIKAQFVWPAEGVITLEFGKSSLYQPLHTGIDVANPDGKTGDPITPFMPGKVVYAGEIFWGFGKHIIVDHGDNITSIYAHLNNIYVSKGQEVSPGDVIGAQGSTGWSTGPHLHFQINIFGIPVNPRVFLGESVDQGY